MSSGAAFWDTATGEDDIYATSWAFEIRIFNIYIVVIYEYMIDTDRELREDAFYRCHMYAELLLMVFSSITIYQE